MHRTIDNQKQYSTRFVTLLVSLLIAIGPVFDPYIIGEIGKFTIRLLDIPMIVLGVITVGKQVKSNKMQFCSRVYSVFTMELMLFVVTCISLLFYFGNRSARGAIQYSIIGLVYVFFLTVFWVNLDKDKFISYAYHISIIAAAFLLLQLLFTSIGITIFDGKMPFLELSEYDEWFPVIDVNTGDIRAHAFFQECSYFGLYTLPVFAYSLKTKHKKSAFLLALCSIASTSLVSVLGTCIIFAYFIFEPQSNGKKISKKLKAIGSLALVIAIVLILYASVDSIRNAANYLLGRTGSIFSDLRNERMGTAKIRIIGYATRFVDYPIELKIFGVGANQFSKYLNVTAYSNVVVSILLNYGIVGLFIFILFLVQAYRKTPKEYRIYCLPFVIMCFSDYQWNNWYFFYLITWFIKISGNANAIRKRKYKIVCRRINDKKLGSFMSTI